MINDEDRKRLERWLRKTFSATTAFQTLVDLRSIERAQDSYSSSVIYSARRVLKGLAALGISPSEQVAAVAALKPAGKPPQLDRRSFDATDWQKLRAQLAKSELLEDRALELALFTGLRAGDVLRIERAELAAAVEDPARGLTVTVKGGRRRRLLLEAGPLRQAAEKLLDATNGAGAQAKTIAEAIVPDSVQSHPYRAAYQRVLRRLKEHGDAIAADGRLHTHRLRRTAAVAALRSGVDLDTVRQLLGHASLATTQTYLDEDRAADVATAMNAFHKQLGGE